LPGLQTILHRKTISLPHDGESCKPDIGAFFLNHIQRTKISSTPSSNRKLLVDFDIYTKLIPRDSSGTSKKQK